VTQSLGEREASQNNKKYNYLFIARIIKNIIIY
jgi:hypothetical protein